MPRSLLNLRNSGGYPEYSDAIGSKYAHRIRTECDIVGVWLTLAIVCLSSMQRCALHVSYNVGSEAPQPGGQPVA